VIVRELFIEKKIYLTKDDKVDIMSTSKMKVCRYNKDTKFFLSSTLSHLYS